MNKAKKKNLPWKEEFVDLIKEITSWIDDQIDEKIEKKRGDYE